MILKEASFLLFILYEFNTGIFSHVKVNRHWEKETYLYQKS